MIMSLRQIFGIFLVILLASSCTVNKDFMFKTDADFAYDAINRDTSNGEFVLAPNDLFSFEIYTNQGKVILEAYSATERIFLPGARSSTQFRVDPDGTVEMPVLGKVQASGLTVQEFQDYLEQRYSEQLVNPYCFVKIVNRRVLVYNGNASIGTVVGLENNNIRLIEALTISGGLGQRANASKIKIIRSLNGKTEVFLVDLSKIEGIQDANMIVENGDIIYVQSTPNIASEALRDINPIVSLTTSIVLLITIFGRF